MTLKIKKKKLQLPFLLKYIYTAGINTRLSPQFVGAPNFRQVDASAMEVYGVALPTVEGATSVLISLGTFKPIFASSSSSSTSSPASTIPNSASSPALPISSSTDSISSSIGSNSSHDFPLGTSASAPSTTNSSNSPTSDHHHLILHSHSHHHHNQHGQSTSLDLTTAAAAAAFAANGSVPLSQPPPPPVPLQRKPSFSRSASSFAALSSMTSDPRKCVWFNVSDRPIVYINGRPFTLRELNDPLEGESIFTGLDAGRIEQMEERLKADVERESFKYGGMLVVHDEVNL